MKNQIPTLLFVERDESALWMYQELFEGRGHLLFSDSISDAKEILSRERVDLIVSCYRFKEGNGIDFLKYIRSKNILVPFVLCTGKDLSELTRITDKNFFIVKKPGPDKLWDMVAFCLRKYSQLQGTNRKSLAQKKSSTMDEAEWERNLLKIPISKMLEALDTIEDLDKIILEMAADECSPEELEKCQREVAHRRRIRWEFICLRMIQDAQLNLADVKRAKLFNKVVS